MLFDEEQCKTDAGTFKFLKEADCIADLGLEKLWDEFDLWKDDFGLFSLTFILGWSRDN